MRVEGCLKISPAAGQKWELPVDHIVVVGPSDGAKYPIPPQKVNLETLRGITHMRPRTGVMGAVMRIRNSLAYATHTFFQSSGFMYVHAPLITGADCEGAGEMFQVTSAAARSDAITPPPASDLPSWPLQVTTCDLAKVPMAAGGVDYSQDFFGKPAYLTVSGQLNGEYYACAFGSIYTFGPTFRAENSNTTRHLAEFWMIEVRHCRPRRGAAVGVAAAAVVGRGWVEGRGVRCNARAPRPAAETRSFDARRVAARDRVLRPQEQHGLRRRLPSPLLPPCSREQRRRPCFPRGLRGEED
mgnify:CR=1 FL=1